MPTFELLGDATWREVTPSSGLLARCLLWRWEHDRAWLTWPGQETQRYVPAILGCAL
ncbi:MAG TPA: hypothetical protein VKT82_33260 [Ktedonobacterales bacterium]|nr:hypothetical protein [Ktedonobacterales bacterium]